jgi:hypothetical protein
MITRCLEQTGILKSINALLFQDNSRQDLEKTADACRSDLTADKI